MSKSRGEVQQVVPPSPPHGAELQISSHSKASNGLFMNKINKFNKTGSANTANRFHHLHPRKWSHHHHRHHYCHHHRHHHIAETKSKMLLFPFFIYSLKVKVWRWLRSAGLCEDDVVTQEVRGGTLPVCIKCVRVCVWGGVFVRDSWMGGGADSLRVSDFNLNFILNLQFAAARIIS